MSLVNLGPRPYAPRESEEWSPTKNLSITLNFQRTNAN